MAAKPSALSPFRSPAGYLGYARRARRLMMFGRGFDSRRLHQLFCLVIGSVRDFTLISIVAASLAPIGAELLARAIPR